MRVFNILGGLGVLLCNIVVSYNHSIELFQSGGFEGWMAHVAVIGAETTFILGALNIVVARLRGVSPGAPAILGGLLGVTLVSWSNAAAGWSYGLPGILLGLATPASLIVAEAMISREILHRRAAMENLEKGKVEAMTEERKPVENDAGVSTSNNLSNPSITSIHSIHSTPMETEKNTSPSVPSTTSKKLSSSSADSSPSIPTVKKKMEKVERKEKYHQMEENRAVEREQAKQERKSASTSKAESVAMEIYEQEGRLPGRKRLMEEAEVSEWEARKILQELRKKVG